MFRRAKIKNLSFILFYKILFETYLIIAYHLRYMFLNNFLHKEFMKRSLFVLVSVLSITGLHGADSKSVGADPGSVKVERSVKLEYVCRECGEGFEQDGYLAVHRLFHYPLVVSDQCLPVDSGQLRDGTEQPPQRPLLQVRTQVASSWLSYQRITNGHQSFDIFSHSGQCTSMTSNNG